LKSTSTISTKWKVGTRKNSSPIEKRKGKRKFESGFPLLLYRRREIENEKKEEKKTAGLS